MNSFKIASKLRAWSLGGFAALVSITASHAVVITPLDLAKWPTGWTVQYTSGSTVDVVNRSGTDYLRIARTTTGTGGAAFWDGTETTSGILGNFSGSVVLQYSGSADAFGVIVGATNKSYTGNASTNNKGYYIGILPNSGLGIWSNVITSANISSAGVVGAGSPGGGAWSSMSNSPMSTTGTYQFDFSVSGATINATLWSLDASDNKVGGAIATISYAMTSDVKGYFGLMGGRFGNNNRSVYFRDVKLEAVPEPRIAILTGSGVLFLIYRARKGTAKTLG